MDISDNSFETLKTKRYNKQPIRSLQEFVDYVQYLQEQWDEDELWYRGVSQSRYKLTPSIYRSGLIHQPLPEEQEEILEEFTRRSRSLVSSQINYESWEWYQTMQHYGLPTRLLDWTDGALIALYFAVRHLPTNPMPSVWVLNPFWLNTVSTKEYMVYTTDTRKPEIDSKITDPYIADFKKIPNLPLAILPAHINERIVVQRSCFTVHGSDRDGFSTVFGNNVGDAQVLQLRISNDVVEPLKDAVIAMGIRESTIFPDLEGLSRELKYEYGLYKKN